MNPAIVSSVSKTLAEMTVFPNWSDVANLAYWVTGTEGLNPSLSAIESFSICNSARDDPNTRLRGRFRIACGSGERSEPRIQPILQEDAAAHPIRSGDESDPSSAPLKSFSDALAS